MPCTDTTVYGQSTTNTSSNPPPIAYGLYPHYIDTLVKKEGALSLEEAIRKASHFPSTRFEFEKRGALKKGFYADIVMFDLKARLKKARDGFVSPLKSVFERKPKLSVEDEARVEELLIGSDMGLEACDRIMASLKSQADAEDYETFLRREFMELLATDEIAPAAAGTGPRAVMVIGVNGVGKTTSIAKLAHYHRERGKKVVLAAADTFRAAAQEQLSTWAERLGMEMIGHPAGGDPAAVAFDACAAAKSRGADYVIIDTAGRLHTRHNLMEELKKIRRVCERALDPGSVEVYLVLDATLGQNSLQQAREFGRNLGVNGIILTQLDSTAKGGIVIAIRQTVGIPVRFIGVGEGLDDFAPFSPDEFVEALLS